MAVDLIELVKSLTTTGVSVLNTPEDIKAYSPFAINRALAQNVDTILFASEMNKRPGIAKETHYKFLMTSIKKKARYSKWTKKLAIEDEDILRILMSVYEVSMEKARAMLPCFSPTQIEELKRNNDKGGRSDRKKT